MITAAKNPSTDLFQQAMGSFETALRAGMKLQEDSARRCTDILRNVGSPLEWEKTVPVQVKKAIATMQQNIAESIRFMNDNATQTVNLMETAMDLQRQNSPVSDDDGHFWTYAINAMRTNAEIIQEANERVLESWSQLAKEVIERVELMREEVVRATELGMNQK